MALLFGKLAKRQPMAGGPASYVFDTFGPFAGMQASLWYWTSCLIGNVAIAAAAAGYLAAFFGLPTGPTLIAAITIALIWLAMAVNMVSPRFAGLFNCPMLFAGLVPLLLVGVGGWFMFDPALYAANWNVSGASDLAAVKQSLVLVFWAYLGLESASVCAAVVENPERNVPLATVAGVVLAAIIYIAVSTVMMGLAPASELATSTAPFALVAGKMFGSVAGSADRRRRHAQGHGHSCGLGAVDRADEQGRRGSWIVAPDLRAHPSRRHAGRGSSRGSRHRDDRSTDHHSPTLGEQFGLLSEAATLFSLLLYLGACAAALKYRLPGAYVLTAIGGAFCICAIALSSWASLKATGICLVVLALFYLPAMRRKYLLTHPRANS